MLNSITNTTKSTFAKLYKEEDGGEILEYALIAGLIVIAAIAAVRTFGATIKGKLTGMNTTVSGTDLDG